MKQKELNRITEQVQHSLKDASVPQEVINSLIFRILKENPTSPWWVIVLKIVAYAIGLILAGYGTTAAAMTVSIL